MSINVLLTPWMVSAVYGAVVVLSRYSDLKYVPQPLSLACALAAASLFFSLTSLVTKSSSHSFYLTIPAPRRGCLFLCLHSA